MTEENKTKNMRSNGGTGDPITRRYGKLGRKIVLGLAVLAIVLMASVSLSMGNMMKKELLENYSVFTHSYCWVISDLVSGERVMDYLESGETDVYYENVQTYMDTVLRESGMTYFYVIVPYDDYYVYIWDAESGDNQPSRLGQKEAYTEGFKEYIDGLRSRSPENYQEEFFDDPTDGLGTAMVPVYDSNGTPVAYVGADIFMEGTRYVFIYYMGTILMNIVLIFALFIVIYYFIIQKQLIAPIHKLSEATARFKESLDVEGEPFHADIHTGDEIEELGDSFEKMDRDLREYITKVKSITADRERISAELGVSETIQSNMLPQDFPAFPEKREFDLYASMTPAKEVGGDFYDYFLIDDDHLGLVIADVSDKGVPAALFMAVSKTLIKNQLMMGDRPDEALGHVNDELCQSKNNEMFVTVWAGILTLSTGEIVYANAGHENPVIGRREQGFAMVESKHGPPLGIFEDLTFETERRQLSPGDMLFLYTDGLPEATNIYQEMLGLDRMLNTLNAHQGATPEELLKKVKLAADHFAEGREPFDDLTMLALSYAGPAGQAQN
ncbi:MAG: SpoIIE family protein phosphatase [Lachnospiraceae bacterium]|nr:SpoIIE family protein phosphatase [Lachnospiraceae bacterium]